MTQFEYLVLVHVVNIKLNYFDNWKALGWAACTAFATLINPLHKPNKNGKNDNGKDPGQYNSSFDPSWTAKTMFEQNCYTFTKIRQCSPSLLIPNNKGNNGTYPM